MRVVLDTCILVAAARSRYGASHALLSLVQDGRFEPVVSVPVFFEYRAALLRPENSAGRNSTTIEGFLDSLLAVSHLQEIFFLWRPALPDADDDLILELAVAGGCQFIITHNIRDFRDSEMWGITAITPGEFLRLIERSA